MSLTLLLAGLNHTTASVAVREQALATYSHDDLHVALTKRLEGPLFPEHVFLSTCNRMEIYAVTADAASGADALRTALRGNGFTDALSQDLIYIYSGRDAATHLLHVAAGLDSLILGEFEILGQVRRAYLAACEHATVGPVLHQLFAGALRLGKRARAQTEIGNGAFSIASASLTLARQKLGTLGGRTALVIGAGEMGRRTAENLHQDAGCSILIANRTLEHAAELARTVNAQTVPFEALPAALARADLVITATHAPHFILDAPTIAQAMTTKGTDSLYIVDLAMPRNVDPAAARVPGVQLFNLDTLEAIVAHTRTLRTRAIEAVQAMIIEEVEVFEAWQQTRNAAPLIAELYARGEAIRQAELEKTLRRLQHLSLTERDRNVIAALATSVVSKLLATPTTQLKAHAGQADAQAYLDTVRELFNLSNLEASLSNGDNP